MALITNNISGSASNNSRLGLTGSVIIANRPAALFPALPGGDVTFFVSGSSGAATGKSVFGGDVVTSGSFTVKTNASNVPSTVFITGSVNVSGDVAANGGDITTTSTGIATLFNTNATTVKIGGVASTVNVGGTGNLNLLHTGNASTGDLTISSGGKVYVDSVAGSIILQDDVSITPGSGADAALNFGLAAASIACNSTPTTINLGTYAISTGTKTVNVGTGGSGGTTNVNIGRQALNSGTTTIGGTLRVPYQPAFLYVANANQSLTFSGLSGNIVNFNTQKFDVGSDFNTATSTFTAPITGKYVFNVNLATSGSTSTSTYIFSTLVTSNASYRLCIVDPGIFNTNPSYLNLNGSIVTDMDINDTAYVTIAWSGGSTPSTYLNGNGVNFSGYLLG